MPTKINKFSDSLMQQLKDPEFICEYLNAAIEEKDDDALSTALGDVAKAYGIRDIADKTDMSRQVIYQMLSSQGNPSMKSINKILNSLGLGIKIVKTGERISSP